MSNATATINGSTIMLAIANGDFDADLDAIARAVQERKRRSAAKGLTVGGTATVIDGNPRYLVGLTVRVLKVNTKTANVVFIDPAKARRFADAPYVRVPLTWLAATDEN